MNSKTRNIIIIAVAAILVLALVLAVPQFLADDDEAETAEASESEASDGEPQAAARSDEEKDTAPAQQATRPADPQLERIISVAAATANAQAPMRIDPITTMTGVEAVGVRLRYRYDVSQQVPQNAIANLRRTIAQQNQSNVCARNELRQMIERGAEIEYAYYGPGDRFLFSTPIVRC